MDDPNHPQNEPATPFKMTTQFSAAPKSLPALRFGRRYRLRLRAVDLCGNSLPYDDPLADLLASLMPACRATRRASPTCATSRLALRSVVLRDERAVTGPGSQLDRLVIRTFNDDPSKDADPADLTASDRFIVPPATSVEVGERLGMFDTGGKLDTSAAMYDLIAERDDGKLNEVTTVVAGQEQDIPPGKRARRSTPALPAGCAGARRRPARPARLAGWQPGVRGTGRRRRRAAAVRPAWRRQPAPGSAALVSFGGDGDWQKLQPFRLALADGSEPPAWDPQNRVLTVSPAQRHCRPSSPLSSYLLPDDLKLMGVWQWLREIYRPAHRLVPRSAGR